MVDRRRVLRRLDPAIRVFDPRGRQLSLNLDVRVDPPRLPERPVLQRDIDADDPLAVHQDRQQIFQRAVVGIEVRLLVADHGGAAGQRPDRVEQVLDLLDGFGAEALDQLVGVGARDPVIRQISEADDCQKPGHRQQHEQRDDARLQPQFSCEEASHVLAAPAPRSRSAGRNRYSPRVSRCLAR